MIVSEKQFKNENRLTTPSILPGYEQLANFYLDLIIYCSTLFVNLATDENYLVLL